MFARLEQLLGAIVSDLEASDPQTHWTAWMKTALSYVKQRDAAGARYFLSAHGGMGSFNDCSPMTQAGHAADKKACEVATRLLSQPDIYDSDVDFRKRQDL